MQYNVIQQQDTMRYNVIQETMRYNVIQNTMRYNALPWIVALFPVDTNNKIPI